MATSNHSFKLPMGVFLLGRVRKFPMHHLLWNICLRCELRALCDARTAESYNQKHLQLFPIAVIWRSATQTLLTVLFTVRCDLTKDFR
jgi:hypothetical protein